MKITGKKSISSIIKIFLDIILITIIIAIIALLILLCFNIKTLFSMKLLPYILFLITAIIGIFAVFNFERIFKNLSEGKIFERKNYQRLNHISVCFIIAAIIYIFIVATLYQVMIKDAMEYVYIKNYVHIINGFLMYIASIYVLLGIGIKILNEIYIRAIENKEENDLTI